MRMIRDLLLLLVLLAAALLPVRAEPPVRDLRRMIAVLRPLHQHLSDPGPGDWLYEHPEPGQSFREYLACSPVLPTPGRRVVYVQPVGPFTAGQQKILDRVVEGMGLYLCLPVKVQNYGHFVFRFYKPGIKFISFGENCVRSISF